MKKYISIIVLAVLGLSAQAQDTETAGRASVGVDYKISKGFHVEAEEEIRSGSNFESLGSFRTTLGLSYKPVKQVKLGVGYTLINPYKSSESTFNAPRHRLYADIAGNLPLGDFQLSLKERLQLTHRGGDFNTNQSTPNALALKSRVGVKYKRWKEYVPSLSFEMRTALNDPWGHTSVATGVDKDDKEVDYSQFVLEGYNHVYNDRYRLNLSCDVKLRKHHTLTPYILVDFYSEYEIDTTSPTSTTTPSKFKSADYNDFTRLSLGLSYVYSF